MHLYIVVLQVILLFSLSRCEPTDMGHIRNSISDLFALSELKSLNTTRQMWADLAHLRASDGDYIDAQDMGVTHCKLFLNGSAFGKTLNHDPMFALHVFLRYSHFKGFGHFKGIVR